jgi:hypothetical protein
MDALGEIDGMDKVLTAGPLNPCKGVRGIAESYSPQVNPIPEPL